MGLTDEQIEARRSYIGGSDAKMIIDGKWHELWRSKMGHDEVFDIDTQFRMALGTAAEPVIRERWLDEFTGYSMSKRVSMSKNLFVEHPSIEYLACNLDTHIKTDDNVFIQEIKYHTGMKDIEELADYYYPQIQHNMACSDTLLCHFTVGFGHWGKYANLIVPRNDQYLEHYLALCKTFWWFVRNEKDPEPPKELLENVPKPPAFSKIVNMEGSNAWANAAKDFMDNKLAAKAFDNSKKIIKELLDDDAAVGYGYGVQAKRAKNGNVTVKEITDKELAKYNKGANDE